jgi:NADH:ubiquinone oxidoreductase subunit 5 (subunit L)/multisubunit Na+/H+ antiporter MnhA subunit
MSYFFLTVAWIGAITGFVAALAATSQRHPQRVMAYSISSIVGYMLTALGLSGLNENMVSGYLAGTTILIIDAFVSALLILTVVLVSHAVNSEDLFNMSGFNSKLAYHGMEVAVFAVINVPPFSGFWLSNWVQNLALELSEKAYVGGEMALVYSGYGLFAFLILTGGVTAFYGLRLMGLIFKTHSSRKKIRKAPRSMRLSFAGLLGITMILDLTVPLLIPLFNNFFLPIVGEVVFQNVLDVVVYIVPSTSTVMTIIALIVGGYISRQLYITREIDLDEVMIRFPSLKRLHAFFLNRCYIDLIYHKVAYSIMVFSKRLYRNVEMEGIGTFRIRGINEFFDIVSKWLTLLSHLIYQSIELRYFENLNHKTAEIVTKLSSWVYSAVELAGFEGVNQRLAENTTKLSKKLRETQTGVLSYNMLIMLIGIFMIVVLFVIFGGYLEA